MKLALERMKINKKITALVLVGLLGVFLITGVAFAQQKAPVTECEGWIAVGCWIGQIIEAILYAFNVIISLFITFKPTNESNCRS